MAHLCGVRNTSLIAGLVIASLAGVAAAQRSYSINFEDLDSAAGPINVFSLGGYFADRNIWIIGYQIGTSLDVWDSRHSQGGAIRPPNEDHNYLTLSVPPPIPGDDPPPPPHRFVLVFTVPVTRFEFVRPAFAGNPEVPFYHPAWTMDLIGADGVTPLASRSEPLLSATGLVPKRVVSVTSPGEAFTRVMFTSDPAGASMPALAVDSLAYTTVPPPAVAWVLAVAAGAIRPRRAMNPARTRAS